MISLGLTKQNCQKNDWWLILNARRKGEISDAGTWWTKSWAALCFYEGAQWIWGSCVISYIYTYASTFCTVLAVTSALLDRFQKFWMFWKLWNFLPNLWWSDWCYNGFLGLPEWQNHCSSGFCDNLDLLWYTMMFSVSVLPSYGMWTNILCSDIRFLGINLQLRNFGFDELPVLVLLLEQVAQSWMSSVWTTRALVAPWRLPHHERSLQSTA